jgi:hypothetical protein
MGLTGWRPETQKNVLILVDALLSWADQQLKKGVEPPFAVKFEWVPQTSGQVWLRVTSTNECLKRSLILFAQQAGYEKIEVERDDVRYLLSKLEEIDLLQPDPKNSSNSTSNGKPFLLKLRSKEHSTNLEHVKALVAAKGYSIQSQPVLKEGQVQQIRQCLYEKIHQEYGKIRILGLPNPIKVLDIYTKTDVWREIVHMRWRSLFDQLQASNTANTLDRLGLESAEPMRYSGWDLAENLQRLLILGKPGIGKTTYLRYLIVQCIEGHFQADKVPIFVQLSQFAEVAQQAQTGNELEKFICSTLARWGVSEESVQSILESGKALICLDGLDEVSESTDELVTNQISQFIKQYGGNSFLITCRVLANKYRFSRENFTEIEVADFNEQQAKTFIQLWFRSFQGHHSEQENSAEALIDVLDQPKHRAIRELAVTPLLLNLICIVFHDTKSLPNTQYQLYEQGINVLLKDWDKQRNVRRDEIYRNLGEANKIELLMQLAKITFEQSRYIFRQETAQEVVSKYLLQSGLSSSNLIQLQVDSQNVIEAIAAHHGLLAKRAVGFFSFSHLTYHEYFTARSIYWDKAWQVLLPKICNSQWREVFLLVSEMQLPADDWIYLMVQQIQSTFAAYTELQHLLEWADQRARKAAAILPYKLAALRAWYLSLAGWNFDEGVISFCKSGEASADSKALPLARTMGLDQTLVDDLCEFNLLYQRLCDALSLVSQEVLANALISAIVRFYNTQLIDVLLPAILSIKQILLPLDNLTFPSQQDMFINWWQKEGKDWASSLIEKLESTEVAKNKSLELFPEELQVIPKDVLQDFYNANLLLLDCLRRAEFTSSELPENIELTLLQPFGG